MVNIPFDPEKGASRKPTPWEIVEKVLIPAALVLLGVSQVIVARKQVEVAQLQAQNEAADASENLQLKYVELFYRDLTDRDERKQQSAISLLSVMKPDLARIMYRLAAQDVRRTPELRQQLNDALDPATLFGPLVSYRLVIYYPEARVSDANTLRDGLHRLRFPNKVEMRPREVGYFASSSRFGDHIRYEEAREGDAAEALMNVLPAALPGGQFGKVRVVGQPRSDGAITIFLP